MISPRARKLLKLYKKNSSNLIERLKSIPVEQVFLFREEYLKANKKLEKYYEFMLDFCDQNIILAEKSEFQTKLEKCNKQINKAFLSMLEERERSATNKIINGTYENKGIIIPFDYLKEKKDKKN